MHAASAYIYIYIHKHVISGSSSRQIFIIWPSSSRRANDEDVFGADNTECMHYDLIVCLGCADAMRGNIYNSHVCFATLPRARKHQLLTHSWCVTNCGAKCHLNKVYMQNLKQHQKAYDFVTFYATMRL